jgi:uncharacterized membrane protein (DUF2068 family)
VDLLVIFAVIGGVFDILGGVLLIVVTSVSISWLENIVAPRSVTVVFWILSVISCLLLITGGVSLFLAYGLWNGRGWAWTWAVSSAAIGLAGSIILLAIGIGLVGVASNGLAIYYLTRMEVKAFFGKAPQPGSNGSRNVSRRFCTNCGNQLNGKEAYCPTCGSLQ